MTDHELEAKLQQAFSHAAPDVLEAVLSDCKEQKEHVIVMTEHQNKFSWGRRFAGMAACLVLLLGGLFALQTYRINNAVDSTVSLDVNPSVEIQVNRKERVLRVTPLNEDGKVIVGDMDFSGSDLKVTVNALIGSMLQNGYLSELSNSILISVDNDDPARGAELQEALSAEVSKLLQTDAFSGAVLSQTITQNDSLQQLAETYGITPGKAQLIQEILDGDASHTFEELAPLSINELNLLLSTGQTEVKNLEAVGTASDKAYIGQENAREIALTHAGVSSGDLTGYEIELDTDHGVMVYEVEFRAGGYEYEYKLNATTGEIIKSEKERDGDSVYTQAGQTGKPAASSSGAAVPSGGTSGNISAAKALEIALAHAGLSPDSISVHKNKLYTDHDLAVYEIKFNGGGYEYEYKLNAATGEIIKSEKERDN